MRIYEIAKEAGVTSAEVLRAAETAGIEASSAISSVEADEAGKLRAALQGMASSAGERRKAKLSRAAELNAQFFAEQKAKLEEHLKIAKEAAESSKKVERLGGGGQRNDSPSSTSTSASTSVSTSAKPAKPVIRMAPGYKPKPAPAISAAATGLTSAGFKPLQHAKPAASISISAT